MKSFIFVMAAFFGFSSAYAADDCKAQVIAEAQKLLDEQARDWGFSGADINETLFKPVAENVYSVEGYIYKATYTVEVTTDSECNVLETKIEEVL